MKITKQTYLADVIYLMTPEAWSQIIDKVTDQDVAVHRWPSLVSYTLGEFITLSEALKDNDVAYIVGKFFAPVKRKWWQRRDKGPTLWDIAVRIKWLVMELEDIAKFFDKIKVEGDSDEKKASAGIHFLDSRTAMLEFAQEKYFLHSLDEAENVKLCDYMVKRQKENAIIQYQRNLIKINQQKRSAKK